MCIDLVEDGDSFVPQVIKSYNASGQYWKITPAGDGTYKLTSAWKGDEMALDVKNDGQNNILQLTRFQNWTGQLWKIQAF